ncbi:head-tail connector protein [Variovorax sp. GT1P44]|uniref:head-tail connector protein n=1 Tax=Variovorax sp. GT1P44 TaxID=3443742 RepID=UPI003F46FAFB
MTLRLQTAATLLPVTVPEAKLHCRTISDIADVSNTSEDALFTSLIGAATLEAEHLMGRAVMPQKWQVMLDAFCNSIALQRPTVSAVDSVKYVDATTGTLTTVNPTVYQFVAGSDYTARVVPAYGQVWPSARSQPEAVQVIFSTGYADAASVPEPIKSWIKLRVGALYENREAWTVGQAIERNEHVDFLLDRYRTWLL